MGFVSPQYQAKAVEATSHYHQDSLYLVGDHGWPMISPVNDWVQFS